MGKLKRIGFILLFLLLVITLSPAGASAPNNIQSPTATTSTYQQTLLPTTTTTQPASQIDLRMLVQGTFIEFLSGGSCLLTGKDILNPENGRCVGVDAVTGKLGYTTQTGGMTEVMGNLIGGTFSIPVSTSNYTEYLAGNFGITKTAYAQTGQDTGTGYQRLLSLVNVWTRFRDLSYLLFVIAFTIIGLAIMLRVKLDARTVMTVQNQIPKIVIALILVTLSYGIAGFLIDMMYVLIYLFIFAFSSITPVNVNPDASVFGVFNRVFQPTNAVLLDSASKGSIPYTLGTSGIVNLSMETSKSIGGVLSDVTTGFLNSAIAPLFKYPFAPFGALDIGCEAFNWAGRIISIGFWGGGNCDVVDQIFQQTVTFIFGAIVFIVVIVAILFTLFRVWFLLIKSFVYILLDVMLGPLWITAGIFPGSKLGFTSWVRHLMGHLSVFPMTFAVILLGKTIMDAVAGGNNLFSPPLIGENVGANNQVLASFVGFGFILSIPTILDRTKKIVGAMDFGLADIKAAAGFGIGAPTSGIQRAMGIRHSSEEVVFKKDSAGNIGQDSRGMSGAIFGAFRK